MPFYLSPLVDVQEEDLSLTIKGLPSSKTGFVICTDTGPANKIVSITNEYDLVKKFGKPNNLNYKNWFNVWNFLQYSSSAYVVRAMNIEAENAGVNITGGSVTTVTDPETEETTTTFTAPTIENVSTGDMYNEDVAELKISNLTITSKLAFYNKYVTSVQDLAIAVCSSEEFWHKPISIETEKVYDSSIQSGSTILPFSAFFDYTPNFANDEFAVIVLQKNSDGYYYAIPNETYTVSYNENARDIYGRNIFAEQIFFNKSGYVYCKVGTGTKVNTGAGSLVKIQHSSDNTVYPRAGSFANNDLTYTGIYTQADIIFAEDKFANPEEFDIQILVANELNLNGTSTIAATRKDCVSIVAPYDYQSLVGKTATDATASLISKFGTQSTNTIFSAFNTYSAVYGNMKYQYDKFNDVNRWMPLGGDIAGLMADTDRTRDSWWATAGLERGKIKNAIKLAFNPGQQNRNDMYVNSINAVISIPGEGVAIVFGQKTASTVSSAFDRMNVRRLLIVLEKYIATAAKYALFEFNDAFTRARIAGMIEPYLRDVKGRRGLYDFRVVVDSTNNTAEVIDRNELVIDVYLKPTKVAEFIKIGMKVTRTDANFEELVGGNITTA